MLGSLSSCSMRAAAPLLLALILPLRLCAVDLSGQIELRFDDQLLELYVHGTDVIADTVSVDTSHKQMQLPFSATIDENGMVVGAVVENGGYTGGLIMNIITQTDTFVTDGWGWRWMINPPAGWEQPGFDASSWPLAVNQGTADETAIMDRDSRCNPVTDSCPVNSFIATGAGFIWAPEDLYFRRTFTVNEPCSASVWAGNRGPHVIYYDGVEVVREDTADHSTEGRIYLDAGTHTLAIFAETTLPLIQGTGGTFKVGVANKIDTLIITPIIDWFSPTFDTLGWDTTPRTIYKPILVGDTLWKVTHVFSDGWQEPSFDDAAWWNASDVNDLLYPTGYPGLMEFPAAAKTIWLPQTIAFRGVVAGPDAVIHRAATQRGGIADIRMKGADALSIALRAPATLSVELFGLDGRRMAVLMPRAHRVTGSYNAVLPRTATHLALLRVSVDGAVLTRMVELGTAAGR
ncbi:MAG: hypothetical protein GF331_26570 [Chitinivibrionales bacterium]|nr:hypothetical protein [Chitinivibrionales bacterium]